MRLFTELRRRNVLRMAVLYVVAAWLIMQVAEVIIGLAELPGSIGPTILVLLAIGFPIALIFSWFYEFTSEGISLEKDIKPGESITQVTGRRLDFLVMSLMCAGLILFAVDKWWMPPPAEHSIAVLPFENLSDDPEQEYFSDGISEDLLNLLAQATSLKVIARSSSFSFKGQNVDIATVAEKLNVRHVLEGSVRRNGDQVRITAQLIDAADSSQVWSQIYDRKLDDIFAVQDEISAAISDALKVQLAPAEGEHVQPAVIKAASTDAYDAYLQGRDLFSRRDVGGAISHIERSLRLDNDFAPAHAQLAIATGMLGIYGQLTLEEVRRIAIPHLEHAQVLAPDLAEAHAGWALLAAVAGDPESEIEHARKALKSNPSYVDAMNFLQISLRHLGRYAEADATLMQMQIIDPLSLIGRWNYAEWLSRRGRFAEAHEIADQLLEQDPAFGYQVHADTSLIYEGDIAAGLSWGLQFGREVGRFSIYSLVALNWVGEYDEARRIDDPTQSIFVDLAEGRFDEAIQATQEDLLLNPDVKFANGKAAAALYAAGRVDDALPLFERLLEFVPEGRPISEPYPLIRTMRLALARRRAGDDEGAQSAAQIVKRDHAARNAAGRRDQFQYRTEAMIAAFEDNPEHVIAALRLAVQRGSRDPQVFDDPIFENLRNDSRFIALQDELDAILAVEHAKVLQLICFNNPVPDDWQPLPETCEGVTEQRVL